MSVLLPALLTTASQPLTSHFCLEISLFWVILSVIFAFLGLLTDLLWVDFPVFFLVNDSLGFLFFGVFG